MGQENDHAAERDNKFREGVKLLHAGRAQEATALLEPLLQENPRDTEVALNLGGAYILQRRYQEALQILESAARDAPGNANIWVNLAAARLGPLEESSEAQQDHAIQAYEEALAANPEVPNVHYMLGLIYRAREDNLRAAAHFTRALEQDPNDRDARRMLASIAAESVDKPSKKK